MSQIQTTKEPKITLAPEKNVLKSQIKNVIMELTEDECASVLLELQERGVL